MDQWEYLPTFIEANANKKAVKQYIKERLPDVKRPPRHMPESMMPQLNELGAEGWELIHMEPVRAVGRKRDVLFESFGRRWSNVYFCVFKRRVGAAVDQPVAQSGEAQYASLPQDAAEPGAPLPPDLNGSDEG